jgi:transcriptional regulator with XRE-family HTH domain
MRRVRGAAGVSLRDLETRGSWRRSTISQVENGKARPSRQLIEWYDSQLGSDGLLLSIYAEARSRQLLAHCDGPCEQCDDALEIVDVDPPAGSLVGRGARLQARVALRNEGITAWRGRELRRMGAYAGLRLIGSAREVAVPETGPGELAELLIDLRAPDIPGSVVAYWSLIDGASAHKARESAQSSPPVAILLVVH